MNKKWHSGDLVVALGMFGVVLLYNAPGIESQNYRMVWIRKHLKDHLVPSPPRMRLPIQPGLDILCLYYTLLSYDHKEDHNLK